MTGNQQPCKITRSAGTPTDLFDLIPLGAICTSLHVYIGEEAIAFLGLYEPSSNRLICVHGIVDGHNFSELFLSDSQCLTSIHSHIFLIFTLLLYGTPPFLFSDY